MRVPPVMNGGIRGFYLWRSSGLFKRKWGRRAPIVVSSSLMRISSLRCKGVVLGLLLVSEIIVFLFQNCLLEGTAPTAVQVRSTLAEQ